MNYDEEKHAERLLSGGWLSNDQADALRNDCVALALALHSSGTRVLPPDALEAMNRWRRQGLDAPRAPNYSAFPRPASPTEHAAFEAADRIVRSRQAKSRGPQ